MTTKFAEAIKLAQDPKFRAVSWPYDMVGPMIWKFKAI